MFNLLRIGTLRKLQVGVATIWAVGEERKVRVRNLFDGHHSDVVGSKIG